MTESLPAPAPPPHPLSLDVLLSTWIQGDSPLSRLLALTDTIAGTNYVPEHLRDDANAIAVGMILAVAEGHQDPFRRLGICLANVSPAQEVAPQAQSPLPAARATPPADRPPHKPDAAHSKVGGQDQARQEPAQNANRPAPAVPTPKPAKVLSKPEPEPEPKPEPPAALDPASLLEEGSQPKLVLTSTVPQKTRHPRQDVAMAVARASGVPGISVHRTSIRRKPAGRKAGDVWLAENDNDLYVCFADGSAVRAESVPDCAALIQRAYAEVSSSPPGLAAAVAAADQVEQISPEEAEAAIEELTPQVEQAHPQSANEAEPIRSPLRDIPTVTVRGTFPPRAVAGDLHIEESGQIRRFSGNPFKGTWELVDPFRDPEVIKVGEIIRAWIGERVRELGLNGTDVGDAAETILGSRPAKLSQIPLDVLPSLIFALDRISPAAAAQ